MAGELWQNKQKFWVPLTTVDSKSNIQVSVRHCRYAVNAAFDIVCAVSQVGEPAKGVGAKKIKQRFRFIWGGGAIKIERVFLVAPTPEDSRITGG